MAWCTCIGLLFKSVWWNLFIFARVRGVSTGATTMLAPIIFRLWLKLFWQNEFLFIGFLLGLRNIALWRNFVVEHEYIWNLLSHLLEVSFGLYFFTFIIFHRWFASAACRLCLLNCINRFILIIPIYNSLSTACWSNHVHLVLQWIRRLPIVFIQLHISVYIDRFSKSWTIWLMLNNCLTLLNLEFI